MSFVIVMLAVIVAQSLMFSYMIARWNAQDPSRSPSNVASAAAADVGAALEANRGLDLTAHLQTHYGRGPYGVFVVTAGRPRGQQRHRKAAAERSQIGGGRPGWRGPPHAGPPAAPDRPGRHGSDSHQRRTRRAWSCCRRGAAAC